MGYCWGDSSILLPVRGISGLFFRGELVGRIRPRHGAVRERYMNIADVDNRFLGKIVTNGDLKPLGVTVHYSADRDVARTVRSLVDSGMGYHFLIDREGTVFQLADTKRSVAHAGKALWRTLSPNKYHIAVSLQSWGKLELFGQTYMTWAGGKIPIGEVRTLEDGTHWDAATPKQEKSLIRLLRSFVQKGIEADRICGHDESALPRGRKLDPGGTLSLSMQALRAKLVEV